MLKLVCSASIAEARLPRAFTDFDYDLNISSDLSDGGLAAVIDAVSAC